MRDRGRPAVAADDSEPAIAIADIEALSLEPGRRLITRHAGLFLFLPLLAKLGFDQLIEKAGYPGTKMVPAANALMSLLVLKLLDKERLCHIDDFNCDEALGLFAGLNILPKKSFATDYSYRTVREHQEKLLQGWVTKLSPLLFPEADSFSLDFHAIGHRGEETDLENHYQPLRGQAGPSVLTFFAMEQKSRVFCYANANLTRARQPGKIHRFVEFWRQLMGKNPQWLYFDSKLILLCPLISLIEPPSWQTIALFPVIESCFFVTPQSPVVVRRICPARQQPRERSSNPAIMIRTCGTVNAGVLIFSPPGLLREEPGCDQRQCLMMMPSLPRTNLIVGQACFSLGTLQAFFDPMLGLEDTSEFLKGCCQGCVRQQVIMLPTTILLMLTKHYQELRCLRALAFGSGLHQPSDHLSHQWPLFPIAHLDRFPGFLRQSRTPVIDPQERNLRSRPATTVRRIGNGQVTHQGVGRHGQQIAFVARPQFLAKPRGSAQFVVTGDPGMR